MVLNLFDNTIPLETGTDGVTSIPGTRTLTSGEAAFAPVRVGDMLRVMDTTDLGDYLVGEVVSGAVLKITEDWPAGSQNPVAYRVLPGVPTAEPIASYVRD